MRRVRGATAGPARPRRRVAIAPYSSLGAALGFVRLPAEFYLLLGGLVPAYLAAVEGGKRWFYRRPARDAQRCGPTS